MFLITSLIEYDMTVKKYFFPLLAYKKTINIVRLDKEISNLQNQKDRIKDVYLRGIIEVEDFSKDYKEIEDKLGILEQKRIKATDINSKSFSSQKLMAERDFEREKLIKSNKL